MSECNVAEWEANQKWERDWWGDCVNTFGEESKQITYAHRMGLRLKPNDHGYWPVYDMEDKRILDLGGGPVSMLLKTINRRLGVVVDPILRHTPQWVNQRYQSAGISWYAEAAEDFTPVSPFDEVWIYNVLQHTRSPETIIKNARSWAPLVRIFEWIDLPVHPGHPHELKADKLNAWLGGTGVIEQLNGENACHGRAYYGAFLTY